MGMIGPRGKKKTGIKSSLGRIFSKKEKGRKDLYMSGGRGELTTESELRLAAQDSTSILMILFLVRCRFVKSTDLIILLMLWHFLLKHCETGEK